MLELKHLTPKNVWQVMRLKVKPEQEDFVATNAQSVIEAYVTEKAGDVALPFGLFDGDTAVGFLMLGYGCLSDEENPSIAAGNYCIWRLMIGAKLQGRGYGRQAMQAALDYIRTWPCGEAEYCWISYEPENANAAALYHSFGFAPNGETDDGEIVEVLKL